MRPKTFGPLEFYWVYVKKIQSKFRKTETKKKTYHYKTNIHSADFLDQ